MSLNQKLKQYLWGLVFTVVFARAASKIFILPLIRGILTSSSLLGVSWFDAVCIAAGTPFIASWKATPAAISLTMMNSTSGDWSTSAAAWPF